MRIFYGLILILSINVGFTQNEANIWYFGENAGLDFNSGSPVALTDGQLSTNEGCATISNTIGELLFYTDGITVWNSNHSVMLNGTGLNGDISSTHSAIIVPNPGDSDIYYIFTVDAQSGPNGMQYSEVDMTLDGGLGGITTNKNILLTTPTTEKLTAVKSNIANEFWVISHKWESNEFVAYNVSDSGVNSTPVISAVGTVIGGNNDLATIGQIKASPDGTKLAVARNMGYSEAQLFDFDASNGVISNPITLFDLPNFYSVYGVEFSPNSKVLYIGVSGEAIYQYNLDAGSTSEIIGSEFAITPNPDHYMALQLASDGKIYVAKSERYYIDFISNPNELGASCGYQYEALYLDGKLCKRGLPPFIQSFFNVGFQAGSGCLGNAIQFSSNFSQDYDTLIWDFGDGNTSTEENPEHIYSNIGTYNVSLTVTAGTETSTDTKNITVYDLPSVAPVVSLAQCDNDLDGISLFDLTDINPEISVNYLNETISFYETELDAENNENSIIDYTNYSNQISSSDVVWARVENSFGCYAISEVNLLVSTSQIPETFIREFYECDEGISTTDGIATFDFSIVTADIEALFPEGQQLDISYYRNESDALFEINPINDISSYENIGYPNNQNIYVRVENALNNDCLGFGHHVTLNVSSETIVTEPYIITQCDVGNDNIEFFNTSNIEDELSNGQTQDFIFSYEDEFGNTLPSPLPNPIEISMSIYTIYATLTDENSSSGCTTQTPISFQITNSVDINPIDPFIACDANLDGEYTFDTSTLETDLFGTPQPDTEISYTDGNGNPISSPFPISFTTSTQTITASITNSLNPDCNYSYPIEFIVHAQPIANTVENDFVCDDAINDGEHLFSLSDYNSQVLGAQSTAVFEVIYFENELDALANTNSLSDSYLVTSSSETIYAKVQNINNPDCYDITSFEIGVNYSPIAFQPENVLVCDAGNDGIESIDLTEQNAFILNGQSAIENMISYHLTIEEAEGNTNPLPDIFTNTFNSNTQTIFVRIESTSSSSCYDITSFDIILYEQPELLMNDLWPICEGSTVDIVADEGYDYYWSSGETTRIITVNSPGTYTVTVSNIYDNFVCSNEKSVTVSISDIATITSIETTDWSQNNNSIIIFVEGNGTYEYSIDGINYQDDNTFSNLGAEEFTVYVRDIYGCGIVSEKVYLLYYPKFFTPNGDGDNDFWQIKNSNKELLNKLYIYDRYGKLITQLKPNDFGWDGTYNGKKLPSNDYWFLLERQNGETYTGHFSLKR